MCQRAKRLIIGRGSVEHSLARLVELEGLGYGTVSGFTGPGSGKRDRALINAARRRHEKRRIRTTARGVSTRE